MPGNDFWSAAEPNWLAQAEKQLGDLGLTLDELGDPTCKEAWDRLESALSDVSRRSSMVAEDA